MITPILTPSAFLTMKQQFIAVVESIIYNFQFNCNNLLQDAHQLMNTYIHRLALRTLSDICSHPLVTQPLNHV